MTAQPWTQSEKDRLMELEQICKLQTHPLGMSSKRVTDWDIVARKLSYTNRWLRKGAACKQMCAKTKREIKKQQAKVNYEHRTEM